MKKIQITKSRDVINRAVRGAKKFAFGAIFVSRLLVASPALAEDKKPAEPTRKPSATLKVGAGYSLNNSPRAILELDLSHSLPGAFGLGVNFGIASKGLFDQGTQPGVQLEQIDIILSSPKLGSAIVSAYLQNSTQLATILTGGVNTVIDFGSVIGVLGIQRNIEGPIPTYAVLVVPVTRGISISAGGVKVLNGPVMGGSAGVKVAIAGIPEVYADLFMLGTQDTREIIVRNIIAGMRFDF